MNSLIVEVNNEKYLIRYKVLKSVVSRKHTIKEGKVINRLELHQNSVVVYLYKITWDNKFYPDNLRILNPPKIEINKDVKDGYLEYLGRGLSKCSDKDKFDKNIGIRTAICNMEGLTETLKYNLNSKL